MTDHELELTRRRVLAGLGTVGAVAAGAGAGTSAYFSDSEAMPNAIVAGETDLKLDWQQTVSQSPTVPVNAYP
ncbi:MAG: SipW-dependent-type signal peptide-containing protein, partial [Halobaculum sp.]